MQPSADPLQTSGALVPGTPGPSPADAGGAGRAGPWALPVPGPLARARDQYRRRVRRTPDIRMVPGAMAVGGRIMQFAVSDNWDAHGPDGPGTDAVWAVNIHGYFAGGGMYWRESARLAQRMGWRVVNPSLPGFGGSDPLEWSEISIRTMAERVAELLERLGAGPAVLLGHSMGGAVAVQFAQARPRDTLGVIYRDGVATPAWKTRHGLLPTVLAPLGPDVAPFADMMAAMVLDAPDLMIGRMYSTLRSLLPDMGRNMRTAARTLPVGSMLMTVDLRTEVRALVAQGMPILSEWGCFDRIAHGATAVEFAECSETDIQWVPGGHSWMLARPQGQADLLTHVPSGRRFVDQVERRWRRLASADHGLAAIG